jgi:hypothetical protein
MASRLAGRKLGASHLLYFEAIANFISIKRFCWFLRLMTQLAGS